MKKIIIELTVPKAEYEQVLDEFSKHDIVVFHEIVDEHAIIHAHVESEKQTDFVNATMRLYEGGIT
jgi:hypothetical protein